jgi:citrate synthase
VKNKEAGVKLMGFGHRVYKNYDPRARIVKAAADRCCPSSAQRPPARPRHAAGGSGAEGRLLHQPQAVPERRLLHRPDLPGDGLPDGHVHRAVRDRPAARLDRALEEMLHDPATKIARPRQVYTGPTERDSIRPVVSGPQYAPTGLCGGLPASSSLLATAASLTPAATANVARPP